MFDPAEDVPFTSISMDVVACDEHRQLAYRTAVESVVLLKNKNNILPIKPSTKKIFVTGPTATSMEVLLGNYYGFNNQMVTLLEGITGRIPEGMGMEYTSGAMLKHPREIKKTWAPGMAQSADFAIVCAGFHRSSKARRANRSSLRKTVTVKAFPCRRARWITSRNLRSMA